MGARHAAGPPNQRACVAGWPCAQVALVRTSTPGIPLDMRTICSASAARVARHLPLVPEGIWARQRLLQHQHWEVSILKEACCHCPLCSLQIAQEQNQAASCYLLNHLQKVGVPQSGLRGAALCGVVRQQLRQQVHRCAAWRQGVAMCAGAHMLQACTECFWALATADVFCCPAEHRGADMLSSAQGTSCRVVLPASGRRRRMLPVLSAQWKCCSRVGHTFGDGCPRTRKILHHHPER